MKNTFICSIKSYALHFNICVFYKLQQNTKISMRSLTIPNKMIQNVGGAGSSLT